MDVDVLDSRTAGPAPRIEEEPVYEESQQYAPIKMGAHSESLLGKQEQQQPAAEIVEEEQKEPLVQAVPCLSVSSSDSIFSISKQNTTAAYTEDTTVIGEIFDRTLFAKINDVDYIKETEQQLEDMKLHIQDKKRLQKERNVLTAQLSRDRKKIEVELLREEAINLTAKINKLRNKLT